SLHPSTFHLPAFTPSIQQLTPIKAPPPCLHSFHTAAYTNQSSTCLPSLPPYSSLHPSKFHLPAFTPSIQQPTPIKVRPACLHSLHTAAYTHQSSTCLTSLPPYCILHPSKFHLPDFTPSIQQLTPIKAPPPCLHSLHTAAYSNQSSTCLPSLPPYSSLYPSKLHLPAFTPSIQQPTPIKAPPACLQSLHTAAYTHQSSTCLPSLPPYSSLHPSKVHLPAFTPSIQQLTPIKAPPPCLHSLHTAAYTHQSSTSLPSLLPYSILLPSKFHLPAFTPSIQQPTPIKVPPACLHSFHTAAYSHQSSTCLPSLLPYNNLLPSKFHLPAFTPSLQQPTPINVPPACLSLSSIQQPTPIKAPPACLHSFPTTTFLPSKFHLPAFTPPYSSLLPSKLHLPAFTPLHTAAYSNQFHLPAFTPSIQQPIPIKAPPACLHSLHTAAYTNQSSTCLPSILHTAAYTHQSSTSLLSLLLQQPTPINQLTPIKAPPPCLHSSIQQPTPIKVPPACLHSPPYSSLYPSKLHLPAFTLHTAAYTNQSSTCLPSTPPYSSLLPSKLHLPAFTPPYSSLHPKGPPPAFTPPYSSLLPSKLHLPAFHSSIQQPTPIKVPPPCLHSFHTASYSHQSSISLPSLPPYSSLHPSKFHLPAFTPSIQQPTPIKAPPACLHSFHTTTYSHQSSTSLLSLPPYSSQHPSTFHLPAFTPSIQQPTPIKAPPACLHSFHTTTYSHQSSTSLLSLPPYSSLLPSKLHLPAFTPSIQQPTPIKVPPACLHSLHTAAYTHQSSTCLPSLPPYSSLHQSKLHLPAFNPSIQQPTPIKVPPPCFHSLLTAANTHQRSTCLPSLPPYNSLHQSKLHLPAFTSSIQQPTPIKAPPACLHSLHTAAYSNQSSTFLPSLTPYSSLHPSKFHLPAFIPSIQQPTTIKVPPDCLHSLHTAAYTHQSSTCLPSLAPYRSLHQSKFHLPAFTHSIQQPTPIKAPPACLHSFHTTAYSHQSSTCLPSLAPYSSLHPSKFHLPAFTPSTQHPTPIKVPPACLHSFHTAAYTNQSSTCLPSLAPYRSLHPSKFHLPAFTPSIQQPTPIKVRPACLHSLHTAAYTHQSSISLPSLLPYSSLHQSKFDLPAFTRTIQEPTPIKVPLSCLHSIHQAAYSHQGSTCLHSLCPSSCPPQSKYHRPAFTLSTKRLNYPIKIPTPAFTFSIKQPSPIKVPPLLPAFTLSIKQLTPMKVPPYPTPVFTLSIKQPTSIKVPPPVITLFFELTASSFHRLTRMPVISL
ncbi:proline-rich extensin-like protein EPR1, partial [Haliotis rubra]|uniref:proline-rich extensin-like protein EPR1 n=1 Tax=Haliotis rubra TaxID=36100 RepID=UPI001EE5F4CF